MPELTLESLSARLATVEKKLSELTAVVPRSFGELLMRCDVRWAESYSFKN